MSSTNLEGENCSYDEEINHSHPCENISKHVDVAETYTQHVKKSGRERKRVYRSRCCTNNSQPVKKCRCTMNSTGSTCSTSVNIVEQNISSRVERRVKKKPVSNIPICPYKLPSPIHCMHCNAKKFHRESKGFCCSFGKIKLQAHCTPNALFELFTLSSVQSSHFRTVVRTYNNHFAFTSFGVKYDKNLCKSNKGIYTFRVQGQVHHYINQLLPNIDDKPSYLQLYFYDTEHELHNRLQNSNKFVEAIVIELMEILCQNPYSVFFRSLNNKKYLQNHRLQIRCHPNLDQRVYNVPSTSQVAGIWVEDDPDADVRPRDICIYGHSGDCHKVQYYYGCYDPLQYPLLFPHGEPGWHEGIERNKFFCSEHTAEIHDLLDPKNMACPEQLIEKESEAFQYGKKRSQISCREYYCCRLQIRPEDINSGLQCEKKLNDEQRYAYDIIMTTITKGYHAAYFIDGPGGTGSWRCG